MKNKLLAASLLAIMSASVFAQSAPAATKPTATPGVSVTPGTPAVAPKRFGPDPEQMAKQQVARFDTNKDGKVSAEEFLKPANESFKRTDINKDSFVTPQELVESNRRHMAEFTKQFTKNTQPVAPGSVAKPAATEKPAK